MRKLVSVIALAAVLVGSTASSALALPVSGISTTAYNEGTDKAAAFFNPLAVSAIDLTLPQATMDTLNANPYTTTYQHAGIKITTADGEVTSFADVGIRLKGQATRTNLSGKAPFKIKLDAFVANQKFMGLTRLTLNSMVQDPSFVHEATIYRLFRAMNIIAPRTTYSWVTVNGQDFGLYMNIESVDNQMLKRWVKAKHLYSSDCYNADLDYQKSWCYTTNYGDSDRTDLNNAIAVSVLDGEQWWNAVNQVADMTAVINLMATDIYTSNWDGYTDVVQNNYFIVFDTEGKLKIIPWGEDGAFPQDPAAQGWWDGVGPAFRGWGSERSVMLRKCIAYEPCKTLLTKAQVAVKNKATELDLPGFKNKIAAVINDAYLPHETRTWWWGAVSWQNWLDVFFPSRNTSLTNYLYTRAPEVPEVTVTGTPRVGNTLTAVGSSWDYTSAMSYQWFRDNQAIQNQNGSTYLLTQADQGAYISVNVTASKKNLPDAIGFSPLLLVLSNKAPSASISGNATVDGLLVASPEPSPNYTVSYKWYRDGKIISTAKSSSYVPTALDFNKKITVVTTVNQVGFVLTVTTSSPVTIGAGTMAIPTVGISGESSMDKTLSAVASGFPTATKLSFQWLRDSVPIANATRSTYKLTALDTKHMVGLRITFSKIGYNSVVVAASGVVVTEGTLSRSPVPTVSGIFQSGKTLTMTVGAWDAGTRLSYQWYRNGVPITNAVAKTYKLTSADVGKSISVSVTGTKAGYQTITRTSASGLVK